MTYRKTDYEADAALLPPPVAPAVVPPHVTTEEVLLRAAELIEERGWIRGRLSSLWGYCAVGAISVAATEASRRDGKYFHVHATEAVDQLARTLGDAGEPKGVLGRVSVERWNDGQKLPFGKHLVVAGLRKAAAER